MLTVTLAGGKSMRIIVVGQGPFGEKVLEAIQMAWIEERF